LHVFCELLQLPLRSIFFSDSLWLLGAGADALLWRVP